MRKENDYYNPSISLSPDFVETIERLNLCNKTKKQFEKTYVVYN